MQSCANDMTIRNVLTIIWSFFTELETDVSKAQYVFTECVLTVVCLCMVVYLVNLTLNNIVTLKSVLWVSQGH